jgi:hypothetical protein
VVSPTGAPVPEAEVACHDFHTRTDADGRADCDVRAADSHWPVYVRVKKGLDFGQTRSPGRGAEAVVVVRPEATLEGRITGELPWSNVYLVANSASAEERVPVRGRSFALPHWPAVRTFLNLVQANPGGDTVLGSAISEDGEAVEIVTGAAGNATFSIVDADGAPVLDAVVYVDRHQLQVGPGAMLDLPLPPGLHVMILNRSNSRARHEAKFQVRSGTVTALGTLAVE